jgi:hypothetical protein
MKKYASIFTLAYLLLTVALAILANMLKIGGAGLNITATIAASFIAAWWFTKEHGRIPTIEENKSYSWRALVGTWTVSLLLAIVLFAFMLPIAESKAIIKAMASPMFMAIGIGGGLVISAIYYLTIRWSFSWYATKHARQSKSSLDPLDAYNTLDSKADQVKLMLKKIVMVLSIVWIGYVGFLYWSAYKSAKPFSEYLAGECPQINIHVIPAAINYATVSRHEYVELIAWYDRKTGKEIFITSPEYRRYMATASCTQQRVMALIKEESAKAGIIEPELRIKYGYMLFIMIIPPAFLFSLFALLYAFFHRRRVKFKI